MKGFTWKDVSDLSSSTAASEFAALYGTSDVRLKGRLVMRGGRVLDEGWYQKKLRRLRKGRSG